MWYYAIVQSSTQGTTAALGVLLWMCCRFRSFRQRGAQRHNVRGRAALLSSRSGRWPQVRRMAWDRDRKARAVCHICGQEIDYHLQPSSAPDSWEPDHVIPVAKAPELELDLNNILASHMKCNRARGDGTNGENAIGMRSRIW